MGVMRFLFVKLTLIYHILFVLINIRGFFSSLGWLLMTTIPLLL